MSEIDPTLCVEEALFMGLDQYAEIKQLAFWMLARGISGDSEFAHDPWLIARSLLPDQTDEHKATYTRVEEDIFGPYLEIVHKARIHYVEKLKTQHESLRIDIGAQLKFGSTRARLFERRVGIVVNYSRVCFAWMKTSLPQATAEEILEAENEVKFERLPTAERDLFEVLEARQIEEQGLSRYSARVLLTELTELSEML